MQLAGPLDLGVQLGAEEPAITSIVAVSQSFFAKARTSLFCRAADLLHLLYYRGWFLKGATRLGMPQGSLWRVWIRSRL